MTNEYEQGKRDGKLESIERMLDDHKEILMRRNGYCMHSLGFMR